MSGFDDYLEHEIQSASGPELRRMLLQKAVALCEVVRQSWSGGDVAIGDQWALRIYDILIELLEGVRDPQNEAAEAVSDLYGYLIRLARESTGARSLEGIDSLRQILEIELETWSLVTRGGPAAGVVAANRIDAGGLHQYGSHATLESETHQGLDLSF